MLRNANKVITLRERRKVHLEKTTSHPAPVDVDRQRDGGIVEFKMRTTRFEHEISLVESQLAREILRATRNDELLDALRPISDLEMAYGACAKLVALARFNHCKSLVDLANDCRKGNANEEARAPILTSYDPSDYFYGKN